MRDIDENNNCVTKSKLIIKVKTLSKYIDRSRVAANNQTKKQTNKQTSRHRDTDILANRCTTRLTVDTRTHRGKQKMKNKALCDAVNEIKKIINR